MYMECSVLMCDERFLGKLTWLCFMPISILALSVLGTFYFLAALVKGGAWFGIPILRLSLDWANEKFPPTWLEKNKMIVQMKIRIPDCLVIDRVFLRQDRWDRSDLWYPYENSYSSRHWPLKDLISALTIRSLVDQISVFSFLPEQACVGEPSKSRSWTFAINEFISFREIHASFSLKRFVN